MNLIYRLPPSVAVALGGIALIAVAFISFIHFPLPTFLAGAVGVVLLNRKLSPKHRKSIYGAPTNYTPPGSILSKHKSSPVTYARRIRIL